jgi:hypothetical protein
MATRSEQARDEEQRNRIASARKRATAKTASGTKVRRAKGRTAEKATYAYEAPREGKPSRKSTRKSANRSKPDAGFNLRESLQKGSPESRARRSLAKASRARGSKT